MRAALLAVVAGCYSPSPDEGLGCSETNHCPSTQSCDPVFHECGTLPICEPSVIEATYDVEIGDCGTWATAFGAALFSTHDGVLGLTPTSPDSNGGCETPSSLTLGRSGAVVELANLPVGGALALTFENGIAVIEVHAESLHLSSNNGDGATELPFDRTAMRWWRLRPGDGDSFIGEFSADGLTWNLLGTIVLNSIRPDDVTVQLAVIDLGSRDEIQIASLGTCPAGTEPPR